MMNADGKTRKWSSLRKQMTLIMVGGLSAGIFASLAFYHFGANRIANELEERSLFGQARLFSKGLSIVENGRVRIKLPRRWEEAYTDPGAAFAYTVFDPQGQPVAISPNIDAPLPFSTDYARRQVQSGRPSIEVATPTGHVVVVSRRDTGAAAVARSLIRTDEVYLVVIWLVLIVLTIPLIWYTVGWNLRSLRRVSEQAAAIGPLSDTRIIADDLPSEIVPLVAAFNGALDRLAGAYRLERQLTADAAHELRTPITVLDLRLQRGRLNGRIDWAAITLEMRQLRRLLDQMLDLARKERIDHAERKIIRLPRLVRETTAMVLPMAEAKGREITVDACDELTILGSADDLRDMLRNLLENALFHGAGRINVSLGTEISSDTGDNSVVMEVTDEGAGVPPAKRDLVFERFSKAVQGSSGAGLGLAIVRRVVHMHGGAVSFVPVSSGCCVRVVLPRTHTFSEDSVCNERLMDGVATS